MLIYGKEPIHALLNALELGQLKTATKDIQIFLKNQPTLAALAKRLGSPVKSMSTPEQWEVLWHRHMGRGPGKNPQKPSEVVHQGVAAVIPDNLWMQPLHVAVDALRRAAANPVSQCVGIVLDHLFDPQNFGSIIRTASFFKVPFVLYGTDRQSNVTATVVKVSAGGVFYTNLVQTANINQALSQLKDAGAWIVGASCIPTAVDPSELPQDGRKWVLVVGNEGTGLRPLTQKICDYKVRIAGGQGHIDSLNVGVATGVLVQALSK